ncbi:hypothetical protein K432DRAFT_105704 [Lepidopterella palustris CBS 459.81]|uniref:Uncharacterized protein n=1 Tax=Lepidopterella palustris CBS 459.81 TaxID=1314670 RepID=A0A8E2EIU4_9PEZI|nr:hypothetical protein K432DRAFT_105704 [Lepidopterella palustris CBS 459.81]
MAARTPAPYNSSSSPPITQHTSLLAHIWLTLLQTRNIDITVSKPAYLAVSLSLRPRVSPRLPPSFIGSPITHAAPRLPPPGRSPTNLVAAALAISSALAAFTPEKVAALLHEAAFVSSPQRYWDAFLGERNLIATSWVRAGMYDIDFFGEKGLRYAEPFMPGIDGIAVLLEAGGKACGIKVGDGKGHWADNGVDAMICARADVLNRMLERSDSLRRFRV